MAGKVAWDFVPGNPLRAARGVLRFRAHFCVRVRAIGGECGSTAWLQLDHIVPSANGGGHQASNLRLRCRRHNLLATIDALGPETMRPSLRT
jgi:5-methylcytosine-specific restriction endonuclease McrA